MVTVKTNASDVQAGITTEHAMNVVLETERMATKVIARCKEDADIRLQDARIKAQKIADRVDERITRIHQRCSRAVTDQVDALQQFQEKQAKDTHSYVVDDTAVVVVVERIADLLITIDKEDDQAAR